MLMLPITCQTMKPKYANKLRCEALRKNMLCEKYALMYKSDKSVSA